MNWKRKSTDIVMSDCGRYFVERIECFGTHYYDAFRRHVKNKPTEIKGLCATADQAKTACEAHAVGGGC